MGFQTGLSGLNVNSKYIDLLGNNVANSNTVGFKQSSPRFGDIFANSLTGGAGSQIGLGSQLAGVQQQFTQGTITTTSNPLDFAINGNGFFKLSTNGAVSYSRNGQYLLDKSGYIVNSLGQRLQGYPAKTVTSASGGTSVVIDTAATSDLQIQTGDISPNATTTGALTANLNASSTVPATAVFSVTDPSSYNNVTSVNVYDSLGNQHTISMYFVKGAAAGAWTINYALDGAASGIAPATSALTFNASGALTTPAAPVALTVTYPATLGATSPQTINLNLSRLSQFGAPFGVTSITQDGYASGRLSGFAVDGTGVILGRYSNGQSRPLGQVALATFRSPEGLQSIGNNQWQESASSGQANVGTPGSGNLGVLQSAAVEDSNVDLTSELVTMITAQRAYQANAQTIRTQDQILNTLVNLR